MARDFAKQSREALNLFEDNEWRRTLQDLADFVVERIN